MGTGNATSKKIYILSLGTILLAFVFLLGYSTGLKQANQRRDAGRDAAVEELKNELADTGFLPPATEIDTISGVVTSIGTDSLEIEAAQVIDNPLEQPAPIQRRILVGADTMIGRTIPKSAEEFDAEMAVFDAEQRKYDLALQSGNFDAEPPEPPTDVTLTEIGLSDIGEGDRVTVVAAENITYAPSFTAEEIVVSGAVQAPPPEDDGLTEDESI